MPCMQRTSIASTIRSLTKTNLSRMTAGLRVSSRSLRSGRIRRANSCTNWAAISGGRRGQNGILTAAYRANVPIFCPAIADSSIGMGLAQARQRHPKLGCVDVIGDIIESANLVIRRHQTASVVLGGGTPKNFINQASVQAEFYHPGIGGHRYALQIVTDTPYFGGASGSTLEEAQSWGKLADDADQVTVHADATVALPLLASALASTGRERLAKRQPARFELGSRAMVVDGAPLLVDRFDTDRAELC